MLTCEFVLRLSLSFWVRVVREKGRVVVEVEIEGRMRDWGLRVVLARRR